MSENKTKSLIENYLCQWCDENLGEDPVDRACRYILQGKAKRLRSQFLIQIAKTINPKKNVLKAALSIEMLHSASLIADDLPSMDNSSIRRGQEAVHIRFGTNTAILASYQLLFYSYDLLAQNATDLGIEKIDHLIRLISKQGVLATKGQQADLKANQPTLDAIMEIVEKKTSTLFYIALAIGCYLANPAFQHDVEIKKVAFHIGVAFQMLDDCFDKEQCSLNILSKLSLDEALQKIKTQLTDATKIMQEIGLASGLLIEPIEQMLHQVEF